MSEGKKLTAQNSGKQADTQNISHYKIRTTYYLVVLCAKFIFVM